MKTWMLKAVSLVTVLCLLMMPMTSAVSADDAPLLGASAFESKNSYLSYDQYESLSFQLGAAASADLNKAAHPLSAYSSKYTLEETKYGWSNPQVIAVMLSSPYWDELDYGDDMTAAGSTAFELSSGVETGGSAQVNVELGLSFSASATAEVFGNGGEVGAELSGMLSKAKEIQSSKVATRTLTFQAGAGDDHVALVVFPMASYKYSYKTAEGKTEYLYANVQLEPVSTVTLLRNYNRVAREYNASQQSEATMLPVMDMYYISPQYETGDPSTYYGSKEEFPSCLVFENGKLMAADTSAPAENRLDGKVHVSPLSYSVTVGQADTGAELTYELSASEGQAHTLGVSLAASVYGKISEGVDIGIVETSFSQQLTVSGELGAAVSHTTLDTRSTSYSIGFIDLPASAQTGVTGTGVPTSDYAFNGSLALWTPTACGANISIAPLILGSIVEFVDDELLPLALPDDIHVDGVSDTTAVLSWSNPDFSVEPFSKRRPDKYEIAAVASGSGGNVYTTVATIESVDESYNITGLSPDTEYTYALRAVNNDGRKSTYSPPVSVTTAVSDPPLLLRYPTDTTVSLGEQPLFYVEAQATSVDYPLTYQWYILEQARYGNTWTEIFDATEPTFNAAYFEADGMVNASNRYMLDGNLYRCVVTENRGDSFVSLATPAARLKIADKYFIRTYDELREIALNIRNGHKEVATYQFVLENDIACPSGESWDIPIGSEKVPFSGAFDGQGHTITGLSGDVTSESVFGLFGVLNGATVKNLHLENANLAADDAYVGGICGKAANATISNCTVSGTVRGSDGDGGTSAGGICGLTTGNTLVEKCINQSAVSGQLDAVGGIVGRNNGTVRNCANHGALKVMCPYFDHMPTNAYCGGIVGNNYNSIDSCYNTGETTANNRTYGETHPLCHDNAAENSYYLLSSSTTYGGRTAEQFASGEVAFALNRGLANGSQAWYQSLDNGREADAYPHLTAGADMVVYQLDSGAYSNSPSIGETRPPAGVGKPTTETTAKPTTASTTEAVKSTTTAKATKTTTTGKVTTTAKPTTTKPATTAKVPDTPKTGEGTQVWLWSLLAAAAATVILISAKRSAKA